MDLLTALFDGWAGIIEIVIAVPIMYIAIIIAIRIVGKRSTSQMNNFDWVVTVAIGSLTASGIVIDSVSIIEALTAIFLLLAAQYLLTKGILSSNTLAKLVKTSPTLLVHDGHFIDEALRRERVTPSEVRASFRENGVISLDEAKWGFLESDVSFSVISRGDRDFSKAQFEAVSNFPPKVSDKRA